MAFNTISVISWRSVYPLLLRMQFLVGFVFLDIQFFLCVCIVHRCLSYLFWPLCCLFFFDLRIFTSPLAFSNSLIGGGNRSTRRKAQTCHMSLTNCITYCYIEYTSPTRFVLFFLPSYCLPFYDLRLVNSTLGVSNFSFKKI